MAANQQETGETGRPPADWFTAARFAGLLGLLLVVTFPQIVTGLETFTYLDYGQFSYPLAFYQRECFWRGELPLWNPLSSCGIPFLAQWNTLTLYPLSLFYLLLPLPWSLGVFCLGHLFLGGLGMYFLAYRWTGNRLAAAVAGTIFAFNGMTWYGLMWTSTIAALGCMPWVVLTAQRGWEEGGRFIVLAALVCAAQVLSGGAEVILLTWLVLAVLVAAQVLHPAGPRTLCIEPALASPTTVATPSTSAGQSSVGHQPKRAKMAARFAGIAALTAGLTAVQILPFLDLLAHSQRNVRYGGAGLGAMPVTGWANYLLPIFHCLRNPQGLYVPPNHWTGSYYLGVATIGFTTLAIWRVRTRGVRLLAVLAVLGVWMAMGEGGLLFAGVRCVLPWLGFMRFSVKFVLLPTFLVPLLAAYGLAWLQSAPADGWRQAWSQTRNVAFVLLAGIALLVVAAWLHPLGEATPSATAVNALVRALFFVGILGCLVVLRRCLDLRLHRLLHAAILCLLWFDVFTHNANLSPSIPPSVLAPDTIRQFFNWDDRLTAGSSRVMESPAAYRMMLAVGFRTLEHDTASRRLAQFFNFNLLDHVPKFDSLFPLNLKEFFAISEGVYQSTNRVPRDCPRLMDFLGISFTSNPTNYFAWAPRDSFLPLITGGQEPVFVTGDAAFDALFDANFQPTARVSLPLEARGAVNAVAQPGFRILSPRFSSHRVEFETDAASPAVVVIAQAFYHPWHGYVDGQRTDLWRANYAFQALQVPGGKHRVSLRYEDAAFRQGLGLTLASLLLCAGIWLVARTRAGHQAL